LELARGAECLGCEVALETTPRLTEVVIALAVKDVLKRTGAKVPIALCQSQN